MSRPIVSPASGRIALPALLALACIAGAAGAQQGPPPAVVAVESAIQDEVAATTWVPGTVVSLNDARVATEVTGRATWVAEVGTQLAAGDALARIEDRALRLQLEDAEVAIARLEAQLAYEDSQVARLERLAKADNAAETQLDEARSRREVMHQNLRSARIQRDRLAWDVERTVVRAPFPGRVVERMAQPGEYVNAGVAVVRLVDTMNKEVRARAPIQTARFVREAMLVEVRDERVSRKSPVRTVIPVGDERSRMIEIRVATTGPEWIVGAPVRVAMPTSEVRRLVAVPRDALVLRGNETFVFRVDATGTAERVNVTTGIGLGTLVEIVDGIRPGDQLVVRGGERLRAGQPVTVLDTVPTVSGP